MKLHEWVDEIHRIVADPDPKRIIAHAQRQVDCEEAHRVLCANGYGQPWMSIVDVALEVPKNTIKA